METPPLSEQLVLRLERAGIDFLVAWLGGGGLAVRRFGGAVAWVRPEQPDVAFMNFVAGLRPEDAGRVPEIFAWFRSLGLRPQLELVPAADFGVLARALSAEGAAQVGFHTMLYGPVEVVPPADAPVAVREIGRDELDRFVTVHLEGHGVPDADRSLLAHWADVPGWRLYLAEVDGEPAASAVLTVDGDLAYLANAATRPAFRGRGCQTALIARRVADAAAAGCTLLCSQAEYLSASHRNLERAGLRVAYTKAVWRLADG